MSLIKKELKPLEEVLWDLKRKGQIHIALLYGSFAEGTPHGRSDIDLAIFLSPRDGKEEADAVDRILMAVDRDISILRLDDEDESPFVVQKALKGTHLVEPDKDTLYKVADWALHESEGIRFRRALSA
ncbi:MAG: nucleotidyltransferase domain-containing protein [Nitrospinae bacterium]|nr:nucleotidyltransferase domain-containing protein [Nitrospinota bacterium]